MIIGDSSSSSTTPLPPWAVIAVTLGAALLTLLGVLVGQLITRRGLKELEGRSRREEVIRILRWAAELGVAETEGSRALGIAMLDGLQVSKLVDKEGSELVYAAWQAVVSKPVQEIEQLDSSKKKYRLVLDLLTGK